MGTARILRRPTAALVAYPPNALCVMDAAGAGEGEAVLLPAGVAAAAVYARET